MSISEVKFIVTEATASELCQWARLELDADPNAAAPGGDNYRITTLYFDTQGFDLFFRRRSHARAEFRIRSYNEGEIVFLERKLRVRGHVLKRRSEVLRVDLPRLHDRAEPWAGRWFARRLQHRRLRPVCQLAYSRTARISRSAAVPVRLTIDRRIRVTGVDTIAFNNARGIEVMPGRAIVEMKYGVTMPLLFEQMIDRFALHPLPISKYRLAVEALGLDARVVASFK